MGREWGGRRGGAAIVREDQSGDIEMALGWTRHAQLGIHQGGNRIGRIG
jgi:hypothetical protein